MAPIRKKRVAASLVLNLILEKTEQKKKRSVWVREWIDRRSTHGAASTLYKELLIEDRAQLQNFLRIKPENFEELVLWIGPHVSKENTHMREAISVEARLMVTLRFLATGDSYSSLAYLFRMPKNTICGIVPEVCTALSAEMKARNILKVPSSEEWLEIRSNFNELWNFPNCIGAVDGKHVAIQAPPNAGSLFFNYKGFHSVILMALVDANYKFLLVSIGANGRNSDGGVFSNSGMNSLLEEIVGNLPESPLPGRTKPLPHVIVADDAFPLRRHIMKPFSRTTNIRVLERVFNYRLSRARRVSENAFGIMSAIFRCLRKPFLLQPKNVDKVVLTTCCLHNYIIERSRNVYDGLSDSWDEDDFQPGSWRQEEMPANTFLPLSQMGSNNYTVTAKEIREEFRDYFTAEGEVSWQYRHI